MPLDHDSRYLLVEDYIDNQNRRDQLLNNEFRSVRDSIDQVKQELKEFKDDVKEFKDDVKEFKDDVKEFKDDVKTQFADVKTQFARIDKRFDTLDQDFNQRFDTLNQDFNQRFDDLDLQYRRMDAYSRNNNLRNPILPINPIVSYQLGRGIIYPESSLYPRNAKEFYALRNPTSPRLERILAYLIDFYDLPYNTWATAPSADEDDGSSTSEDSAPHHDITVGDAVRYHSDLAVDVLEGILGLNQENFDRFIQRAAELQQNQSQSIKRPFTGNRMQLLDQRSAHALRRRQDEPQHPHPLAIRPFEEDVEDDEKESSSPRVGWANGTSPSIIKRIRDNYYPRAHSSDKGSTTNPLSSVRQSSREASI